ncbi:MAG: hypothetical protein LBE84_02405 [Planctomycetota bacterium]|nr:hypothetical protein [Planctomycetota bacterium]
MEESARLECPECGQTYRLKRIVEGKSHACRKCGAILRLAGSNGSFASAGAACSCADGEVHRRSPAPESGEGLAFLAHRLIQLAENLEAETRNLASNWESRFSSLEEKTAVLLERFDPTVVSAMGDRAEAAEGRLRAAIESLREVRAAVSVGEPGIDVDALADSLSGKIHVQALVRETTDVSAAVAGVAEAVEQRLQAFLESLRKTRIPLPDNVERLIELDVGDLADRLSAKIQAQASRVDSDGAAVVDAVTKMAEELVREQDINTARIDSLTNEIRNAAAAIANLEEWRGSLPDRVADEIGRTVQERMVGPISGALARQAPAILSDLQDNKLVDIVSRSVREAQRPLLREIISGGRNGVPVWLFASVIIPLLLVLGYLFLPGEFGAGHETEALARLDERLAGMEENGLPLARNESELLRNLDDTVMDLHAQAMAHARNSAALEEQVRNLNARLAEKDLLVNEYRDTLQRQMRLLNAYRARLTQLGVTPETIAE